MESKREDRFRHHVVLSLTVERCPALRVPARRPRYNPSWVDFEERVDLAVRITAWLGLYTQGVASVALGPDAASLLFEGGGLDFGGKVGAVFRLYRNDRTRSQVAVRAQSRCEWLRRALDHGYGRQAKPPADRHVLEPQALRIRRRVRLSRPGASAREKLRPGSSD